MADTPNFTPVKDLTAFAIDVLGVPIRIGLARNPLKTDEQHVQAKLEVFAANVMAIQGVTSLSRFAVPGHPNCTRLLLEEIFEELYTIPYLADGMWKGVIVDGVAGFAMTSPPPATIGKGPSPFGTAVSRAKSGNDSIRESSELLAVRNAQRGYDVVTAGDFTVAFSKRAWTDRSDCRPRRRCWRHKS